MIFPLYSFENGNLVSLEGHESKLYKLLSPDLEQKREDEKKQSLNLLESDLKGIRTKKFLKIYSLDGEIFVNAEEAPFLGEGRLSFEENPLETFFGGDINSDIDFYENYLTIGLEFQRLVCLKFPPSKLSTHGLSDLTPEGCSFVLNLERIETSKARARIDLKRRMHFSGLFKEIKDHDSENAFDELEEILEGLSTNDLALFNCEVFFLLSGKSKEELDEITDELFENLNAKDAKGEIETRALPYLYKGLIPGVAPRFLRNLDVPSTYLKNMIPFHHDHLMEEGISFSSTSDREIWFNLFDPGAHNYNLLITGSSGQGKSMVAGKLIKEELSGDSKVVCLDLGNSFKKNALYHKASIFSEKFNPLQFRSPRYLKEFILACVDEKFSKKEEGRLFEAIEKALESNPESFKELVFSLENDFPGLKYYFIEIFEFFTNETSEQRDFTYCDLSEYPEAIKAPLVIFLIEYFKNLEGKKIFVFDECWSLLENNASYIAECFRTFRKHNASAVAISQNLDDFSETQLGRVIVQNTFFKFFFRSDLGKSEFVSSFLAKRVSNIQTVKGKYSEFVVATESLNKPTRFYPSPFEYELLTSDSADQGEFDCYMEEKGRFLEFSRALENFTEIKYPDWRQYA